MAVALNRVYEPSLTASDRLLSEYLQWLTIEKGRSRATIEAYRRDVVRLLGWMDKHHLEVGTVRERDLEQYCNTLRRQKRAESSISRGVASIRGWFAYLLVEGYVELDPSARLKGGRRGRTLPNRSARRKWRHSSTRSVQRRRATFATVRSWRPSTGRARACRRSLVSDSKTLT